MDIEKTLFLTMLLGAFIWTFYRLYKMDDVRHEDNGGVDR